MARTIKNSLQVLDTSRADIRTALSEKEVTAPSSLKVSDVDDYIRQIEAGGGTPQFEYIDYIVGSDYQQHTENPYIYECKYYYYTPVKIEVKIKKQCHVYCSSSKVTGYPEVYANAGDTVEISYTPDGKSEYIIVCFSPYLNPFSSTPYPDMLVICAMQDAG